MKKIFAIILLSGLIVTLFAQTPQAIIHRAYPSPIVDGVIDDGWNYAYPNSIDKAFRLELPTLGILGETYWMSLWDNKGFYILVNVTDDNFLPQYVNGSGNVWDFDMAEIYFDVNYMLKDGMGPSAGQGHYSIAPVFTADNVNGTPTTLENGVSYAFMVNANGWIGEYFIPFTMLKDKDGIQLDLTGAFGFDVTVTDRDFADEARRRAVWANTGAIDESWNNMDDCGIIVLECGCIPPPEIISISLTDGAITEDNGTLQLTATIDPSEAANAELKWTVVSEGGRATISSKGLLAALVNGDVKVTAMATDGSWIKGNCTVHISGQIVTIDDINEIKNGNFDATNNDSTVVYWGGWTDYNAVIPRVIDGNAICSPVLDEDIKDWRYQFFQAGLKAKPDIDYILKFRAWSDADRLGTVDFEDTPHNNYTRYGISSDPESNLGLSEWFFNIGTEPFDYLFHVNFDRIIPSTYQKLQFMFGQAPEKVYLDSVYLYTVADYGLTTGLSPETDASTNSFVYPNPASGSLHIKAGFSPGSEIVIYNSTGRLVLRAVAMEEIDITGLSKGLYVVKLMEKGKTTTNKLVVE
jgi:hypothetical protein